MEPIAKIIKANNRKINDKHPLFTHFLVIETIRTDNNIAPIE